MTDLREICSGCQNLYERNGVRYTGRESAQVKVEELKSGFEDEAYTPLLETLGDVCMRCDHNPENTIIGKLNVINAIINNQ